MTISSGGFNVNFNPTPTIFEQQTTGQVDQKNAGDVRGNAVILPQSQNDDITFTKLDNRNKWDYKSEPERPSLMPHTLVRAAGAEIRDLDEGWKTHYNDLLNQLPEDTKLELAGLPTIYTAALKCVLDVAANALNSLDRALLLAQTENALARVEENKKLPDKAFQALLSIGKELMESTKEKLQEVGPNVPGYLEAMEFLNEAKELFEGRSHV